MSKAKVETITLTRKITRTQKKCPVCGDLFWGSAVRKYCSSKCRFKANYDRNAEQYRAERMERYRQAKQQAKGKSSR